MSPFDLNRSSKSSSSSRNREHTDDIENSRPRRGYIESKRVVEDDVDQEGWIQTYADMVTLLLTFFILFFSISKIDQSKFEEFKSAISDDFLKKETVKPFTEVNKELERVIKEQNLEDVLTLEKDPLGVKIQLASSSLYPSGSAEIRSGMQPVIQDVAGAIDQLSAENYIVEVEGHTDDIPVSSSSRYQSNWELSAHRATNVIKLLNQSGIPIEHLKASAFADSRPLVPNRTPSGEAIPANQEKNRRVVIYVRRASELEQ